MHLGEFNPFAGMHGHEPDGIDTSCVGWHLPELFFFIEDLEPAHMG